ncbi:MAG TPA: amidohydrolase family protein, partial [Acidimicrobiales bacterium]|nr:amidohydrolase family protein [Acidimicrobiales bacterium]
MVAPFIIDADTHITEPADVWASRVPARVAGAMPQLVRNERGVDVWMLGGQPIYRAGVTAPAGWPGWPPEFPPTIEDCHPAAYDSTARLGHMDENGIWACALYPNIAGFGSQQFLAIEDDEAKRWAVRGYNDFLFDWTSVDPRRFITVVSVPFWDVAASVAEVERCAGLGARGVLFTGEPQRFGLPFLADRHWEPLWSVAEEAGLPIHFHIGGGEGESTEMADRMPVQGHPGATAHAAVNLFMKNGIQCADLILSGVLARHPDLDFVSVESGAGWVPFMLETADYSYLGAFSPGRARTDELLPSELFFRQVYVTYWFEEVAPRRLLDELPVDNVLFETDFPHTACLYGNITETIDRGLGGVSDEVRHKLLWA